MKKLDEMPVVSGGLDLATPPTKQKWRWWELLGLYLALIVAVAVAILGTMNMQIILASNNKLLGINSGWFSWTAATIFGISSLMLKSIEWILSPKAKGIKLFRKTVIYIYMFAITVWLGGYIYFAANPSVLAIKVGGQPIHSSYILIKVAFFGFQVIIGFLTPFIILTIAAETVLRHDRENLTSNNKIHDPAIMAERIRLEREADDINGNIDIWSNEIYNEERLRRAFESGLSEYRRRADMALQNAWMRQWNSTTPHNQSPDESNESDSP